MVKSNILDAVETASARISKAKKLIKQRNKLAAQNSKVSAEVSKFDKQIAILLGVSALGKNISGKKRGPKLRTKRFKQPSLVSFIYKTMKPGKAMDVKSIRNAVKKNGYKTHQKNELNFRSTIGAALRNDPRVKHGKKRGTYILKTAVVSGNKKKTTTKKRTATKKTTVAKKTTVDKKTDNKSTTATAVVK